MKTTVETSYKNDELFPMSEMRPCEVCVVVDEEASKNGEYVMRTANNGRFEVMCLTPNPRANMCWDYETITIKVRRLRKGESITLTFEGE